MLHLKKLNEFYKITAQHYSSPITQQSFLSKTHVQLYDVVPDVTPSNRHFCLLLDPPTHPVYNSFSH